MDDEEGLRAPSNALKLKHDIHKIVRAKWAFIMKNTTDEMARKEVRECDIFLQLMSVEWASKVRKIARTTLPKTH